MADKIVLLKPDAGTLAETEKIANQMIEKFPAYWSGYNNLSLVRLFQRKRTEALQLIDKALSLAPSDPEVHYQRMFVVRALGEYEEALASLDRAQTLNPTAIHYLLQAAIMHRDAGNPKEALAAAEKMIAIEPTNAEGYAAAGRALLDQKDYRRAEEMLRKALSIDANFAPALANLARMFLIRRNLREAQSHLERAAKADARDYETQLFHGDLLVQQKRQDDAIAYYQRAIEYGTFPGWLASHPRARLGRIYENKGDNRRAIEFFERAMLNDPRGYASLKTDVDRLKARLPAEPAPR